MALSKRYDAGQSEPELEARWQADGLYLFKPGDSRPIYSIDSPPATVSGNLHLGHVYSYSHPDFMARFFRMRGYNVFYPMGFDDNGLPTERLVEKRQKVTAAQIGRDAFIERCLQISDESEKDYQALWQRLGLSIDWRYSYRTIDPHSRRCSQHSFIDLHRKGLAYRAQAPSIWCPECRTAIAQADLEDRERTSEFITLPFESADGAQPPMRIATTRPELLAACVAVFVHPEDARYRERIGQMVRVPLYGQPVPVLADLAADPSKGTGAVMCCTFGDQADVAWWYGHHLPLIEAIDAGGRMLPVTNVTIGGRTDELTGLPVEDARKRIKEILAEQGLVLDRQPTEGTLRVHERCDTPVEFRILRQWFIRVLDNKEKFLELGRQIHWHPEHMRARYLAWVENLNWDWCISRQRTFGVAFPLWYCKACGEPILADESSLPVNPLSQGPGRACACGSTEFEPETDVMDTWATSSVSPEIVSGWLDEPERFEQLFPMTMRPQAHDIIRTWAFYSILKAWYHFGRLPWSDVFISGWGIAGEGMGKISKSKGGGPMPPMTMIERYSADAVRYWAASTAPGKDAVISEEKIQMGAKLVTKLWNVARFAEPFIQGDLPTATAESFTPTDAWILASLRALVERATASFEAYDYASAKNEVEGFFWRDLADNYLEMAKLRLYDPSQPAHLGARWTLKMTLKTLLKLLAPLLPYVTDTLWRALFAGEEGVESIHQTAWPEAGNQALGDQAFRESSEAYSLLGDSVTDTSFLTFGGILISLATAVRRYKSEKSLSLGSEVARLVIATKDSRLADRLRAAAVDISSVTRAQSVEICAALDASLVPLHLDEDGISAGLEI